VVERPQQQHHVRRLVGLLKVAGVADRGGDARDAGSLRHMRREGSTTCTR